MKPIEIPLQFSARFARHATALAAACTVALGGCASAPAEHFYTLESGSVAGASAISSASTSAGTMPTASSVPVATRMSVTPPNFYVEVSAVNVPPQVNRSQLVVSAGAGRVELLEQQRWASPLAAEIGRALSLGITSELGVVDVFRTPYPEHSTVYRVNTNVQRFESAPGQLALLDAVWSVRQVGGNMVSTCRSVFEEQVGPGYDALVAGHARAVTRLSASIAAAIRSMAAGLAPVCGKS